MDTTRRHNELYERACQLSYDLILLDDRPPAPLDETALQRLTQAVPLFEEAISLRPGNWAAVWVLGKFHQRLEVPARSLEWFARVHRVNPDQPDVAGGNDSGDERGSAGERQSISASGRSRRNPITPDYGRTSRWRCCSASVWRNRGGRLSQRCPETRPTRSRNTSR